MLQPNKNIKKAAGTTKKILKSSAISQGLSKIPFADEIYDIANIVEGLREGDYKKIGSNVIGALIPGVSGKVFEAVAEDWLPPTPEIEKRKMKFNLQSSPAERQEFFKKYGPGYLSNPQFIKDQKLVFGTNSQGIMKAKMNPRKKYANGSSAKGMNTNNYIISPAEALNDYNIMMAKVEAKAMSNPWLPIVAAVGGAAQSFVGNANQYIKKPGEGDDVDADADAANGMNNVQQDVEVEGGEMYETPQGQVGEFKGPSHAQGGIPLEVVDTPVANPNNGDVQKETKVYSKDLMLQGKSLAERKATRERQVANLEKIASQPLIDQAIKNASKRKMMAIQKEEMADLDFQDKVNNMQQMADTMVAAFGTGMAGLQGNPIGDSMRYGYGSGSQGVMKYELGTDEYGIDPLTGRKLPKPPTADMETNVIKIFQDDLGMDPSTPGYGKIWGPKSKALYKKQFGNGNVPTQEELLKDPWGWASSDMDITREGYKYLDPEAPSPINNTKTWDKSAFANAPVEINPMDVVTGQAGSYFQDNVKKTISQEPASNLDVQAALNGTGMFAKTSEDTDTEKPTAMGNLMRSLPGMGDMTKLFGNYLGMKAGIDTATEQRASDVTKTNVYRNAGEESQRMLDNAKKGIDISKAQAIVKATANTRGGKKGARNSARGVNQMRGMDWLYDTALNQQTSDIIAGAAEKMSAIDVQKSGVAMNADQMKGAGEWQAIMANSADKDAYFTALGLGRKDFATGLQQSGKDLNDMKQNKVIENLMKQYGQWFKGNADGSVGNKNAVASNSKKSTKEGEEREFTDSKGNKIKLTQSQIDRILNT